VTRHTFINSDCLGTSTFSAQVFDPIMAVIDIPTTQQPNSRKDYLHEDAWFTKPDWTEEQVIACESVTLQLLKCVRNAIELSKKAPIFNVLIFCLEKSQAMVLQMLKRDSESESSRIFKDYVCITLSKEKIYFSSNHWNPPEYVHICTRSCVLAGHAFRVAAG